jgi:hypothetical protein
MSADAQDRRVKTALDETRLLILGAQILFGFHLNGAFQQGFDQLSHASRALHALSFLLMALAIALLIAPSLQHRIVDRGYATARIQSAVSRYAASALFPFALSLGLDLYIVLGLRFGAGAGLAVGATFSALAIAGWYGAELILKRTVHVEASMPRSSQTPVETRVEHMLTEARVLLPGVQAMFGFQLSVLLTQAYAELPSLSKGIHAAALLATALAMILLMAPAAFHRITYEGQSTEGFHTLGSALILAAAVPLALGIVCEMYVAVAKALDASLFGMAAAAVAAAILVGLWLCVPLLLRARGRTPA